MSQGKLKLETGVWVEQFLTMTPARPPRIFLEIRRRRLNRGRLHRGVHRGRDAAGDGTGSGSGSGGGAVDARQPDFHDYAGLPGGEFAERRLGREHHDDLHTGERAEERTAL